MRRMYVGGEFYCAVTQGEQGRGEGFDLILPNFDQFFALSQGSTTGAFFTWHIVQSCFLPLKALGTRPFVDLYLSHFNMYIATKNITQSLQLTFLSFRENCLKTFFVSLFPIVVFAFVPPGGHGNADAAPQTLSFAIPMYRNPLSIPFRPLLNFIEL